ncbi:kynurenine formamidase-like isoform X1 [Centruroides sculpturatus]|uniref:kynurenine formamidase-like isoform X1 n=1 Tax=Centruroides sculpturatus TaxID=218467 RepID=UPI000C6E9162|nr:kynurenine formamidase-like isoform X1 [Centruroides sculpturatus]XP_023214890.1 kynurenine formamidase-like isoform X1 [Centruroides sculpturatus]XP_023214891.1 kynurenine formamidase-like isoform X1 [Centruroides sculpturatus]
MISEEKEAHEPEEEINYMPSNWSHRYESDKVIENFINVLNRLSEDVTKTIPHRVNVKCENFNGKGMDIFSEDLPNDSPIFAFIHGGFWSEGSKEMYHYLAKLFRSKGVVTTLIGHNLAPSATLTEIIEEIKQTILCLVQLAAERKSKGIYLSGHSSGAHLAAMFLSSEWKDNPKIKKYIKGVVLISGIYDIYPLLKTSVFEIVHKVTEKANPSKFLKEISSNLIETNIKILIAIAEHDPPKFIEQSQHFQQKLQEFGVSLDYLYVQDEDHFSIVEKLHDESFILTQRIINLICEEK